MICRVLGLIAIFFIHLAAPSAVYADPRLETFIKKFNKARNRIIPMAHEDSPFYTYHDRSLEEGLDAGQRKLLHIAQEEGDCVRVIQLVKEGFLGHFPFLKPAFNDVSRRAKLTTLILRSQLPETTRCSNHSLMKELLSYRKRDEFPPVDFAKRYSKYEKWKKQEKLDPDLKKLRLTLGGFGRAALCDDYRPSITDLRAIVNKPGGVVLTHEEQLFLLERARFHKLDMTDYDKTIERLSGQFNSNADFVRLRDGSMRGKLVDIPFPVEGSWQKKCRFQARWRRGEE